MSDSWWPYGLYSPWNSLGQNTGVGSLSLLQWIFPTQGSNPGLHIAGGFFTNCAIREVSYEVTKRNGIIAHLCMLAEGLYNSVQLLMSDSLQPHGLQYARLPCPPPSPRACLNLCSLSWWYYLTISSSAVLFSFGLQSFPASGSFPVSWLFASGGQSIRSAASAVVLLMSIHHWLPLGLTGLISLQSKGLSRVFSSTTVRKHQFFSTKCSLRINSNICTQLLEKS